MMHVSWTTLREQIFAKLRRPYRSEANMNEVGHACRIRSSRHNFCFIGCATIRGLCVVLVACLAGNYCFIDVFSTFFNSFNAHIHVTPFQNLKSKRFFMNGKFNFNNFLFYNFFLFVCECKLQKFTMTGSSNF
jgi:hypothetical protein